MSYDICPFCGTKGIINEEYSVDDGDVGNYTYEYYCPNCSAEWNAVEYWTKLYEGYQVDILEGPDKNSIEHYTKKDKV